MSLTKSVYNILPHSLQNLAASVRGHQLNWWRYGKDTERLVEEAFERESWSIDQWNQWREERLAFILERARKNVPYYKEYWDAREDSDDWKDLANWPVLEKETLRERGSEFVSDDVSLRRMFETNTSGTTGAPLRLFSTRETLRHEYAIFEARVRRWNGVSRHDRWAMFGGQTIVPVAQTQAPFWVWNSAMNQLYMSVYHVSEQTAEAYLDALARYEIEYVIAFPSAINSLAKFANKRKRKDVRFKFVVANAETLYAHQRDEIAEAFGCPVRETYGMAEWVAFASECLHGGLHVSPEAGVLEDDGRDLIATGLMNKDMPLIRYRVGDRITLSDSLCSCGRTLPLVQKVDGRFDDVIITRSGREHGSLDVVFKAAKGITEAQIVQKSLDLLIIRYVPDESFDPKVLEKIRDEMCGLVNDMQIEFEQVESIPRTSNGKFPVLLSEMGKQ